jgi:hypothetical protein
MTDNVPPHVAAAAKVVDDFLRNSPSVLAGNNPPPRETAAQKFARLPRADSPAPMPPYDPNRKD